MNTARKWCAALLALAMLAACFPGLAEPPDGTPSAPPADGEAPPEMPDGEMPPEMPGDGGAAPGGQRPDAMQGGRPGGM